MNPLASCSVMFGALVITPLWVCLLVTSLVTRPEESTRMRWRERLLIVASAMMIAAISATYFSLQAQSGFDGATTSTRQSHER